MQLQNERFDILIQSPLARAQETAQIIWNNRSGEVVELPSLREVDLYSFQVCCCNTEAAGRENLLQLCITSAVHFQGLLKHEGKERFGQQYKTWQKAAAQFELDSHAPIRYAKSYVDSPQRVLEHSLFTTLRRIQLFGWQFWLLLVTVAAFCTCLEGSAVCRELWYRASLAWQDILTRDDGSTILLVAHNAVNQVNCCCL